MDIRDVRRIYRIRDVLGIDDRKRVIVCPLPMHPHHHNTPSFAIGWGNDGAEHFHCHGACGKEGDVIDLVGYLNIPGYNDKDIDHVRRAIALLEQSAPVSFATPQYQPEYLDKDAWMEFPIREEAFTYLEKRGLSPATAIKFRLGQRGDYAISIPAFVEGELRAIKFRRIKGDGMRYWSVKGSKKTLFNVDNVMWKQEPVLILKGEIAVMLLDQLGFNACCLTGGEAARVDDWRHYLSFATKRVLVGDNDFNPETRSKMQKFSAERAMEWNAELRFPPDEFKDIDDWILGDPNAVEVIRSWL